MDDFTTVDVQTSQATIIVRSSGSGPPVLLLHGFPQNHLMWRKGAPLLAAKVRANDRKVAREHWQRQLTLVAGARNQHYLQLWRPAA